MASPSDSIFEKPSTLRSRVEDFLRTSIMQSMGAENSSNGISEDWKLSKVPELIDALQADLNASKQAVYAQLIHDELALAPGGMLVLEHSIREPVSPPEAPWCSSTRTYGETALSFFEKMSIAQEKPCPTGENAELPSETASGEEVCP